MTSCFASSFSGVRGYSQPAANMDYPQDFVFKRVFQLLNQIMPEELQGTQPLLAGQIPDTERDGGGVPPGGSQLSPSGVRSQAVLAQGQKGSVGPSPSRDGRWRPQGRSGAGGGAGQQVHGGMPVWTGRGAPWWPRV